MAIYEVGDGELTTWVILLRIQQNQYVLSVHERLTISKEDGQGAFIFL